MLSNRILFTLFHICVSFQYLHFSFLRKLKVMKIASILFCCCLITIDIIHTITTVYFMAFELLVDRLVQVSSKIVTKASRYSPLGWKSKTKKVCIKYKHENKFIMWAIIFINILLLFTFVMMIIWNCMAYSVRKMCPFEEDIYKSVILLKLNSWRLIYYYSYHSCLWSNSTPVAPESHLL